MNKGIAIIYSTADGHTLKISETIANHLKDQYCCVHMCSIEQFRENPSDFDCVVIGASVRYGNHNGLIRDFILKNKQLLAKSKTAFFSVNLVARNEGKNRADNNPYLIKFLDEIRWQPDIAEVFAGKLDYSRYSFFDKLMIKLIMRLTNGPTKTDKPIIYTNWDRVREFAQKLTQVLSTQEVKQQI